MSQEEPGSQIVPQFGDYESCILSNPSSPPVASVGVLQKADNEYPELHSNDMDTLTQHASLQHDSFGPYVVEETQFESMEQDTQAVDDPDFLAGHQSTPLEANLSMLPPSASTHVASLITRTLDTFDPTEGFTFGQVGKLPVLRRPPVLEQQTVSESLKQDTPNGKFKASTW